MTGIWEFDHHAIRKPLVKVARVDPPQTVRRIGFMAGEIRVPDDFDRMAGDEIQGLFAETD